MLKEVIFIVVASGILSGCLFKGNGPICPNKAIANGNAGPGNKTCERQ